MKTKIILVLIILLAAVLRFHQLGNIPPSISWDEAAVGYNAFTIANFGMDEYGNVFPAFFKSFGDDKHPVHIYFTALSVKLLGLTEFSTRFPAAIFSLLSVVVIFYLAKLMFASNLVGFLASLFFAVSPYALHFARFNHEVNFALFFYMLGLTLFYKARKNAKFLPLSVLSFRISFFAYHPSKVIILPTVILLAVLYGRKLLTKPFELIGAFVVSIAFIVITVLNPQLLGIARVNQTALGFEYVKNTASYKLTQNEILGRIELTLNQYSWHFLPQYLFISGDKNPRLSSQVTGQFYMIDALFLIAGAIFLIKKRSKEGLVLLVWALLAPLPSALVSEAPHSARAMYMMGSWHIIAALGFYWIFNFIKKYHFKIAFSALSLVIVTISFILYQANYYKEYSQRYAIDWQYGMKEIVQYVAGHKEYEQVFMTAARSQPYIFFLYYLKTPLPDYLRGVIYNNNISDKSYNNVSVFDRFSFTGWNPIESDGVKGVLYVLTPSEYDGLRFRSNYDVKEVVKYPNGTNAFFLVSLK